MHFFINLYQKNKLTINFNKLFLLILICFNCCAKIENRGYNFDLSNYKTLQTDISNKERTVMEMGLPSFSYNYEEKESWFYYSFTTKNYLFLKPKIINQKILAIDFNQEGFITNIQDFENKNNKTFKPIKTTTEIQKIKEDNWLKDLFSNIGRVRPI